MIFKSMEALGGQPLQYLGQILAGALRVAIAGSRTYLHVYAVH